MSRRPAVLLVLAASLALAAAAPVTEDAIREIGADLRCVVCQSLSVADSPSETAHQMREIIRERLRAGETPDQIKAYFVEKYGLWILLAPPRQGFNLLVWIAPFAALLGGLVVVALVLRRWTRRSPPAMAAALPIDDAMRARIRRELGQSGHD